MPAILCWLARSTAPSSPGEASTGSTRGRRTTTSSTSPSTSSAPGAAAASAAWLIERAGYRRGQREGAVGLSTAHALAVVAHDGARAADVLGFARRLQASVAERFGVRLALEPAVWE